MYGEGVYTDSAFTFDTYKNKKDTLAALLGFVWRHGQSTDTGLGIDYMVENFLPQGRPNAAQLAIVITDGASQNPEKTALSAKTARDRGATVLAVGVGSSIDEVELNNIAGNPDRVLTASDYSKLNSIKHELIDLTCVGSEYKTNVFFALSAKHCSLN
ncbi:unnamed protein product [Lymnaea stagnalis]|uniref:VWFA domain-containing protein n=1 Tax=Lymnaea stagnalis TaxID=6523 RepID=A0AAV2HV25_LYMST